MLSNADSYRDRCLQVKRNECYRCFSEDRSPYKLLVHHIDGDRENNDLDNLIPLCGSCHQRWHKNYDSAENFWEFLSSYPNREIDMSSVREGRGLLNTAEAEILTGQADATEDEIKATESLVRNRVKKQFGQDADILEEHFDEVFEMIQDEVCDVE